MAEVLAQFTNNEDGMTAFVVAADAGGFNVSLRDDDANEFVPLVICGIKTLDAAIAKAQEIL